MDDSHTSFPEIYATTVSQTLAETDPPRRTRRTKHQVQIDHKKNLKDEIRREQNRDSQRRYRERQQALEGAKRVKRGAVETSSRTIDSPSSDTSEDMRQPPPSIFSETPFSGPETLSGPNPERAWSLRSLPVPLSTTPSFCPLCAAPTRWGHVPYLDRSANSAVSPPYPDLSVTIPYTSPTRSAFPPIGSKAISESGLHGDPLASAGFDFNRIPTAMSPFGGAPSWFRAG